jgi:hypothetical protein
LVALFTENYFISSSIYELVLDWLGVRIVWFFLGLELRNGCDLVFVRVLFVLEKYDEPDSYGWHGFGV